MTFPAAGSAADLALLLCRSPRRLADRHRRPHRQHRGVLRPVTAAQQPVDLPDPAQGRREAGRRQSRCHPVPQPGLRRRHRAAGAGDADRGDRRAVGVARRRRGARLGRRLLEPVLAVGPGLGHLGSCSVISLRTHAISLAAVFLALAIGVALGSGLLSNTVLSGLRDDKHELQNQINTLTDEKNALNEKLSAAGEFDAQMSPRILHDALAGKSVVVFRTPDANDDDVDALSRMVGQAGGTVTGTVALTAGVRRRQLRGEAAVGGELADRARRSAAEHHVGGPGIAGGRPVGHRAADQQGSEGSGRRRRAARHRARGAARHRLRDVRHPAHRRGQHRADRHRRRA